VRERGKKQRTKFVGPTVISAVTFLFEKHDET
jgi:hypothetical protein